MRTGRVENDNIVFGITGSVQLLNFDFYCHRNFYYFGFIGSYMRQPWFHGDLQTRVVVVLFVQRRSVLFVCLRRTNRVFSVFELELFVVVLDTHAVAVSRLFKTRVLEQVVEAVLFGIRHVRRAKAELLPDPMQRHIHIGRVVELDVRLINIDASSVVRSGVGVWVKLDVTVEFETAESALLGFARVRSGAGNGQGTQRHSVSVFRKRVVFLSLFGHDLSKIVVIQLKSNVAQLLVVVQVVDVGVNRTNIGVEWRLFEFVTRESETVVASVTVFVPQTVGVEEHATETVINYFSQENLFFALIASSSFLLLWLTVDRVIWNNVKMILNSLW